MKNIIVKWVPEEELQIIIGMCMMPSENREIQHRNGADSGIQAGCDYDHNMLALEGHSTCPECGAIPPLS
jgi:hypothetical protein